ncbi:MAG TPA: SPW repeat protein [Cyclobacteriaceae bacterium]|nr:SPW repeat protein [Cyclobacteriaceae bacterium]
MKPINRKTHGYLDYLVGALLIAAPWLFNFYEGGIESWIPIILGAGAILYSLITDYELGITGIIPMRTHLKIDMVSGLLLAASPWLFGFADNVFWPHLLFGILEIVVPLLTKPGSQYIGKASDLEKL